MSRQTVEAQIARLEALSRQRELDERESWQLQKMISTQRRYLGARPVPKRGRRQVPAPATPTSDSAVAAAANQGSLGPRPAGCPASPEVQHD